MRAADTIRYCPHCHFDLEAELREVKAERDRLREALRRIAWLETPGMEGYDEAVDIARAALAKQDSK